MILKMELSRLLQQQTASLILKFNGIQNSFENRPKDKELFNYVVNTVTKPVSYTGFLYHIRSPSR